MPFKSGEIGNGSGLAWEILPPLPENHDSIIVVIIQNSMIIASFTAVQRCFHSLTQICEKKIYADCTTSTLFTLLFIATAKCGSCQFWIISPLASATHFCRGLLICSPYARCLLELPQSASQYNKFHAIIGQQYLKKLAIDRMQNKMKPSTKKNLFKYTLLS